MSLSSDRNEAILYELSLALWFAFHRFQPASYLRTPDRGFDNLTTKYWDMMIRYGLPLIIKKSCRVTLPDMNCAMLLVLCTVHYASIDLRVVRIWMISAFFRGLYYAEHLDELISKYTALFEMKDIPELSPMHHLSAMETSVAFIARIFNISGIVFVHQVVGG